MTHPLRSAACVAVLSMFVSAAAVGCSSPEPNVGSVGAGTSSTTDGPSTSSPVASEKDRACEADSDCAVIETECCDHCNGGKVEAYRKEVAPSHKKAGCEQTMCTERGCGAASAVCKDKVCSVVIAPLDGPPVGS